MGGLTGVDCLSCDPTRQCKMSGAVACGGCGRPIGDRYLLRVGEVSYHERCLACSACGAPLQHSCYARQAKLFCRIDYDRLYGKKCLGCGERVTAEELVMRAQEAVFHVRCFVCVVCGGRLQRGDHYVVKQGQLFCRLDYEKEVEMLQGYAQGDFSCDDLLPARCADGRRGPKRPRTILTTQQRRAFKASFEMSPKPCRKIREGLAKDTGLSVRIVQVWFQNQRAKMKKIQKKARDNKGSSGGSKDSCDNSDGGEKSKIKIKEEDQSPHGLSAFLNDSGSDAEAPGEDGSCAPHRHFLPIKQELAPEEAFYKDQSGHMPLADFAGMTPAEKMDAAFLNFPYSAEQQHALQQFLGAPPLAHAHQASLNPIDRLYSMQSSYFCADETTMVDQ